MKKLIEVKYSDVLQFYLYLLNDLDVSISTVETIHGLLHPTFDFAVRDDILRKNPSDDVMANLSKKTDKTSGIRYMLTREQQRAFMDYMVKHPVCYHWWLLFTVLLCTGMRIGECLGIRWEDLDFERHKLGVNHSIVYRCSTQQKNTTINVSLPEAESGIRTIPTFDIVKDAFDMEKEEQAITGGNTQVIDGMSGFIFCNSFNKVHNPQTVNDTIRRICNNYNAEEVLNAKKEGRNPDYTSGFLVSSS